MIQHWTRWSTPKHFQSLNLKNTWSSCQRHTPSPSQEPCLQALVHLWSFGFIKIMLLNHAIWGKLLLWTSVQSLSHVQLFVTARTAARQSSLSITNSQSLLKLMSFESVMPSNHLIFCRPLLLLPSIFPSIRLFSHESALRMRWPKYWSFSFSISPSNEHPGLVSFRVVSPGCSSTLKIPKWGGYRIILESRWKEKRILFHLSYQGFPGGSVVKNLPANAGEVGPITDVGRSHMPRSNSAPVLRLLSLCSRAGEPQLLSPCPRAHASQDKPLQ